MTECKCISEINAAIKDLGHSGGILTNLFGPPRATVATYETRKVRGKKMPIVLASFRPFCGVKYPAEG